MYRHEPAIWVSPTQRLWLIQFSAPGFKQVLIRVFFCHCSNWSFSCLMFTINLCHFDSFTHLWSGFFLFPFHMMYSHQISTSHLWNQNLFHVGQWFSTRNDFIPPGSFWQCLEHFWLSQRAVGCVEAGDAAKCLRCTGRSQQQRMSQSSVSAAQRFRNRSGFTPVDLSQHLRSKLSFCAFFEGK